MQTNFADPELAELRLVLEKLKPEQLVVNHRAEMMAVRKCRTALALKRVGQ